MASKQPVDDDFVAWCARLEWATAARPDCRDDLLNEVVKRARELIVKGQSAIKR